MSLFNLTQEIAIDLGTANTIIISNGEIVVDEPSVIAIHKKDDRHNYEIDALQEFKDLSVRNQICKL